MGVVEGGRREEERVEYGRKKKIKEKTKNEGRRETKGMKY